MTGVPPYLVGHEGVDPGMSSIGPSPNKERRDGP